MKELYSECIELLNKRNVTLEDIADCTLFLQKPYNDNLTVESVIKEVEAVIRKREVQYAILTGINLDMATEEKTLNKNS